MLHASYASLGRTSNAMSELLFDDVSQKRLPLALLSAVFERIGIPWLLGPSHLQRGTRHKIVGR
jgi:hypothetical protein